VAGGGDDKPAMAAVLTKLRDLGLPFLAAGPSMHPGDIFESLRKDGLVTGEFLKIFSYGLGAWVVTDGDVRLT
jgi:hypothetical protein